MNGDAENRGGNEKRLHEGRHDFSVYTLDHLLCRDDAVWQARAHKNCLKVCQSARRLGPWLTGHARTPAAERAALGQDVTNCCAHKEFIGDPRDRQRVRVPRTWMGTCVGTWSHVAWST